MQQGRPAQRGLRFFVLEIPVAGGLPLQAPGGFPDALGLGALHVVPIHQRLHTALADVLMGKAPQQVLQQAFAQGAAGHLHVGQPHLLENAQQNRQAGGEDRLAVVAQAFQ